MLLPEWRGLRNLSRYAGANFIAKAQVNKSKHDSFGQLSHTFLPSVPPAVTHLRSCLWKTLNLEEAANRRRNCKVTRGTTRPLGVAGKQKRCEEENQCRQLQQGGKEQTRPGRVPFWWPNESLRMRFIFSLAQLSFLMFDRTCASRDTDRLDGFPLCWAVGAELVSVMKTLLHHSFPVSDKVLLPHLLTVSHTTRRLTKPVIARTILTI